MNEVKVSGGQAVSVHTFFSHYQTQVQGTKKKGGEVLCLRLRRYYTPNLKLACFVRYLKIINTFWKIMYAS